MKDYDNSAQTLAKLLEKYPETLHREEALFRLLNMRSRWPRSLSTRSPATRALLEVAPDGEYAGRAHMGLALAHYAHKDFAEAADLFYGIMTTMPTITLTEEVYNWTGSGSMTMKNGPRRYAPFEVFLEAMPAYPYVDQIRFKIAECSERAGDQEKAIAGYTALAESEAVSELSTRARWQLAKIF